MQETQEVQAYFLSPEDPLYPHSRILAPPPGRLESDTTEQLSTQYAENQLSGCEVGEGKMGSLGLTCSDCYV